MKQSIDAYIKRQIKTEAIIEFYKTIDIQVFLYNSETWSLYKEEKILTRSK